jgi:hypothetical protein
MAYNQWVWRSVQNTEFTVQGLDALFGADTSLTSLLNLEMLRKFKVGSVIAFFAWCLILPPFFTPATLYVYPSTNQVDTVETVPQLAIWNSSFAHSFTYSPPKSRNTTRFVNDGLRIFTGPRTVLTLLSKATASLGQILPIAAPYNHSSYELTFPGPIVRCANANETVSPQIYGFLKDKMSEKLGTAIETDNAYFGFVPVYNEGGNLTAVWKPRNQAPSNATNELWMTFSRYVLNGTGTRVRQRVQQVCKLYNATYDLRLEWHYRFQTVTGNYEVHEEVPFPNDANRNASDLTRHAYSAFFWVLTDQVVGSLSWYEEPNPEQLAAYRAAQFGVIDTPIQHNSLLGSSDLAAFFDFSRKLYQSDRSDLGVVSPQRMQDINLAKNRTMDVLIEELSFNITVSLLHNVLLT